MKLKICGMKNPDNILEVATLNPDYLGFIFHKDSPRYVSGALPDIPPSIAKVGVFVNSDDSEIEAKIKAYRLDLVQLHGQESPELCRKLSSLCGVIKSFSVGRDFDFNLLKPYEGACKYFLFDTKGPRSGGNGYHFDWDLLKPYPSQTPFFLSGGIDIGLIDMLKGFIGHRALPLHGLDVNSRFELSPGLKDIEKLREFKALCDIL